MMWDTPLTRAFALVAPYYNILFVLVALYLFVELFKTYKPGKVYLAPWAYLFGGMMIFVLETLITILRDVGLVLIPRWINGFFELAIVSLFIYAVLLQKEYIKHTYAAKPKKR